MATEQEKIKAFLDLVGEEDGRKTLKQADTSHQTAEEVMMLAFKETDESLPFEDRILEAAIAVKEAALEREATKAKKRPPAEEPDLEEDDDEEEAEMDMDEEMMPMSRKDFKEGMAGYMAELKSYWDKKTAAKATKEADTTNALKEVSDAHTARIAGVESTVKALTEQLATATKELAELKGELPPSVNGGVRPSQSPDNVVTKEAILQAAPKTAANGDAQEFFNFIAGGIPNGGQ